MLEHVVVVYLRHCLLDGIRFINDDNISDLQMDEMDLLFLDELTNDEEILAYCELCCAGDASDHLRWKKLDSRHAFERRVYPAIPLQQGGHVLAEDAATAAGQARGFERNYLHRCGGTVHTAKEIGISKQIDRSSANFWPSQNQQEVYNGHRRIHALKYHSAVLPNSLIANLFGPMEGRRHDAAILAESGLLAGIRFHSATNKPLCLYGDSAYPLKRPLHGTL